MQIPKSESKKFSILCTFNLLMLTFGYHSTYYLFYALSKQTNEGQSREQRDCYSICENNPGRGGGGWGE